jgi:hypothetical protein
MFAYLCGAVEYAPDQGKGWRGEITPFLQELGHQVFGPTLDDRKNLTPVEIRDYRTWKGTDFPRFQKTVRKIIDHDLTRLENRCDYLVAYWDEYAGRGGGTQGEITVAYRRALPVYLVIDMPIEQVSGWILGCATEVFTSFDELKDFLRKKFVPAEAELAQLEPVES